MSQANNIIDRISPVAISSDEFRRAGHRLVDQVAEFLDLLPASPITRGESPSAIREAMDAARPLPREGSPTTDLLDRAATLLFDHSLFNGHPSFWGYITSSPAPIGMLGDFLASAVNANCGAWLLSPICCCRLVPKPSSKSPAIPNISAPKSASSVCSTPGIRSSNITPTPIVWCPLADCPSITLVGFHRTLASFFPSRCSERFFAVSLSSL